MDESDESESVSSSQAAADIKARRRKHNQILENAIKTHEDDSSSTSGEAPAQQKKVPPPPLPPSVVVPATASLPPLILPPSTSQIASGEEPIVIDVNRPTGPASVQQSTSSPATFIDNSALSIFPIDPAELAAAMKMSNKGSPAVAPTTTAPPKAPPTTAPPKKTKKKRKKQPSTTKTTTASTGTDKPASKDLPPPLAAVRYAQRDRCEIAEECNPRTKEGPFKVVTAIVTGKESKGNYRKWHLHKELKYDQLRQLASNFGCVQTGSMSKFDCRVAMAREIEMSKYYERRDIPNPHTSKEDKRINTLMRIVNACMLPENINGYIDLNNRKVRKDFEAAGGSNPIKKYWLDISEAVNDSENNDRLKIIIDSREDEDEHLHDVVSRDILNLADFDIGSGTTCQQNMVDLMKARHNIRQKLAESGTHSNDPWTYLHKKNLTVRPGHVMPGLPVYYLDRLCVLNTEIDSAFTVSMDDRLKSDSGVGYVDHPKDNTAKKKQQDKDEVVKMLEEQSKKFDLSQAQASSQRAESLALQKQHVESEKEKRMEESDRAYWAEWERLGQSLSCLEALDGGGNPNTLKGIVKRIRFVEAKINLTGEESIVNHYD